MKKNYSLKHFFLMFMLCMIGSVSTWAQGTIETFTYNKVTSATDLVSGATYIIVGENKGQYYAMGHQRAENRGSVKLTSADGKTVSIASDIIASATSDKNVETLVYEIQLQKVGNKWKALDIANNDYLAGPIDNAKSLAKKKPARFLKLFNNDKKATIDLEVTATSMVFVSGNANNNIQFNAQAYLFNTYGSGQKPISLYKKAEGGSTITIEAPTFSLDANQTYTEPQKLTMSATNGAAIYYTLDGVTTPTSASTKYESPITLSKTTTVKAVAILNGNSSAVTTATFNIEPTTPIDEYVYVKVTDTKDLIAGATYIIINESNNVALGASHKNEYRNPIAVNCSNGKIILSSFEIAQKENDEKVFELVLGGNNGAWSFKDIVNKQYLCASNSSKNHLKLTSKETDAFATITFNKDKNVDIKFTSQTERNWIRYNETPNQERFSCYTNGQSPIQLYRKVSSFSIKTQEGFGTYYTNHAFVMPEGVEGGVVTDANNGALTIDYRYTAGKTVPAKTPLLLKGTQKEYTYAVATSTEAAPTDNLLQGATADGVFTDDGNHVYYKLAYNNFDTKEGLGFYYGAANGAPFNVKKGLAYLAVPKAKAAGIKCFSLEGNATGIEQVENDNNVKVAYTLDGRRVNADNLSKGLYIINGKKVIIK